MNVMVRLELLGREKEIEAFCLRIVAVRRQKSQKKKDGYVRLELRCWFVQSIWKELEQGMVGLNLKVDKFKATTWGNSRKEGPVACLFGLCAYR